LHKTKLERDDKESTLVNFWNLMFCIKKMHFFITFKKNVKKKESWN